eukprot:3385482-Prorocentrum_lima.AAC.1
MTSSLVGSEMCIRDSISLKKIDKRLRDRGELAKLHLKHYHMNTQNAKPVSYTHLTLPTICSV